MRADGRKTGSCLCGKVSFQVDQEIEKFSVCHCHSCRRWASGPYFATDCGKHVEFSGEDNIGRFQSSSWAERGFCKICGTSLFYYLLPTGHYMMSVGTFDEQNGLDMKMQGFMEEKPDGYDFANACEKLTGEEVFAKYAPKQ